MSLAAKIISLLFLLLITAASFATMATANNLGPGGAVGALFVLAMFAAFLLPAVLALGRERPRLEAVAIVGNKMALFVLAAALLAGFITTQNWEAVIPFLPISILLALCCVLNVLALTRQKAHRVTPNNSLRTSHLRQAKSI